VGVLHKGKLILEGTVETLKNADDEKLESVFFRLFQEVAR
jgi:ABC-type Na+ transport system ATPase subunit NatA